MRGADAHGRQGLNYGLAVAVALGFLSWIGCVPVDP